MSGEPKQNAKSCTSKIGDKFKGLDRNGEAFQLKLDSQGSTVIRTIPGAIFSILSLFIVGIYAVFKYDTFQRKNESEITLSTKESFFSDEEIFDSKKGLAIAVAFMDHDENMLDPEQGELAFYRNEWDFNEKGSFVETYEQIPSRPCTDQDLGWDGGDNSQFYPMSKSIKDQVGFYRDHYLCIDSDMTKVSGNYDSKNGRMIYIRLSYKCKIENKCTKEEKSKKLFKGGWLHFISNRIRFDNKQFGEEALLKDV